MNVSSSSCSSCGPWWRLPLLLAIVLAAILLSRGRGIRETTETRSRDSASQLSTKTSEDVSIAIDFGGGRQRQYGAIAWREGMTVRDSLTAAGVDSADRVKFAQQGSGQTAFLTQFDGVKNEGAGGRNWIYTVNGQLGDRSFAIYELRPGDKVLWTFASQQ